MTIEFPDQYSALAALGLRPQLMGGYLRVLLQQHFGVSNNIEQAPLRSLLWTQQRATTNLFIDMIYNWRPEQTEFRPALLVKRNDWQIEHLGIDDRRLGVLNLDGVRHYGAFITGSHTLFCLSTQAEEAELLGMEVAMDLLQFSSVIREEMCLLRFRVLGAGALFQVAEDRETYAVPVTVAYSAEERWRVLQHAPVLKRLAVSYFANGQRSP